jgi:hypothetical protein
VSTRASVVRAGPRHCPSCRSDDVLVVITTLVVGAPMSILLCSRCRWSHWSDAHETDSLDRAIVAFRDENRPKAS